MSGPVKARVSGPGKDWDRYVAEADALAQTPAFQNLRDAILEHAAPAPGSRAVDVGAGTGLLTLPLAKRVASVAAVDISEAMVESVRSRARAERLANVEAVVGLATELPLEDGAVDLVVSNYCFHHLEAVDKRRALSECFRVLEPGGRLVFADMMFELALGEHRDRAIIASKIRALARKGPGGWFRLARHAARAVTGAGEQPASPEWWRWELIETGFVDVGVEPLVKEAGIAVARRPA